MTQIESLIRSLKTRNKDPLCVYIYDLVQLQSHVAHLVATLPASCQLFYAVKANPEAQILKTLSPIVHGFEVASLGEIEQVRAVDSSIPILFGGPGKTDAELAGAIRFGVRLLHIESISELERLEYIAGQVATRVPILLRVNLRGPLPTATLRMAGIPTQFGIDEVDIPAMIAAARRCPHVEVQGFHFHSLSNNLDPMAHARLVAHYIERAQAWAREFGLCIDYLNAGGGIGVNYADLRRQFDWMAFTAQLSEVIRSHCPSWTLCFECGRYLTAACGYYAAEVLDMKRTHGKHYVIVRGGTHHFRLPASWQHSHPFTIIPIEAWPYPFPRSELRDCPITVAGQLCTPKDVLATDVPVARVRIGDVLLFPYAGAYGWHISHHDFLSHPHPEFLYSSMEETQEGIKTQMNKS